VCSKFRFVDGVLADKLQLLYLIIEIHKFNMF
jgi:hypothetical protein